MTRTTLTIMGAILVAATRVSGADDLKTYRDKYYKSRVEIVAGHTENVQKLHKKYAGSLDALFVRVKKAGDLQKTLAVKAEIARYQKEKTMPATPATVPDIKNIQTAFSKYSTDLGLQKGKQLYELAQKYDAALDKLQRRLVSSDKLDEATAIQAERDRAKKEALDGGATPAAAATADGRSVDSESRNSHLRENSFEFKGHGYYRLPLRHTFPDARLICRHLGGHILAIDNSYEYDFIQKKITETPGPIWLDITDEKVEGTWRNWRGARPGFLKWHKGEPSDSGSGEDAACLGYPKLPDMADAPTNKHFAVICEWDPGMAPRMRAIDELGLCEISVTPTRGVSIQTLTPGVQRLSGGYKPRFSHVSPDLIGAQFLRVPWQSRPTHNITVTKQGYLYAYKIHEWADRAKFPWERVPDAVGGAHHGSGADRIRVKAGDTFTIKSYETGVIASKIAVQ